MAKGGTNANRVYWTAVTEATVPCRPRQTGKTSQTPSPQLPPHCGVGSARGPGSPHPSPATLVSPGRFSLSLFSPPLRRVVFALFYIRFLRAAAAWLRGSALPRAGRLEPAGGSPPSPHTAPPQRLALTLGAVMDSNTGQVLTLISSLKPLQFFIPWLLCSYYICIQI